MRFFLLLVLPCLMMTAVEPAVGQPSPLSSAGTALCGPDAVTALKLITPTPADARSELLTDQSVPFMRVHLLRGQPHPWDVAVAAPTIAAITKGDTIFLECWLRTIDTQAESGEAALSISFERASDPYPKIILEHASVPVGAWTWQAYAGVADESWTPGAGQITFHLGARRPQTVDVASVRVINLGPGVDQASLPSHRVTYPGRSPDAPWRAAAAQRIDQLRKGDVTVAVTDATGAPLPGARVQVDMVRHAFPFGAAVAGEMLLKPGTDGDRYRQWITDNCSKVVIENHLKWENWDNPHNPDPGWNRETTLACLDWLRERGIPAKGHCLVWPSWTYLPKHLRGMTVPELRRVVDEHIGDILDGTAGKGLVEWDVINEATREKDLIDLMGTGEMVRWFRIAREHFSGGLIYNDYAHLTGEVGMTPHRQAVEELVAELRRAGAPVTGMGIQAHLGSRLLDPALVDAELTRLGETLHLPLSVTEFDLNQRDLACQADYLRDFLTVCFANQHCSSFLLWGFWEGAHWTPTASLIRRDWTIKPAGQAWHDLVRGAWWTKLSGTTDAAGRWSGRGYRGRHRITATLPSGQVLSADADIGQEPLRVSLHP